MPLYTLKCPCGMVDEFLFDIKEDNKRAMCPDCGDLLTVAENRDWQADLPTVQGDTVVGGATFGAYFDPGLNKVVTGRAQRREEMKKRGLEDYSVEAPLAKTFSETAYIRKHSRPGDKDAAKAIRKEHKTASDNRTKAAVRDTFAKAPEPIFHD